MSGFFLSLLVGGFLNIVFSMTGASTNETIAAFLIGAIPGAIFILLWRVLRGRNPELASGMLVGGCVIALIGGACGASMVGMGMH